MTIDDVTTIDLTVGWAAELARLRAIEAAAREVLASGQARYVGGDDELSECLEWSERVDDDDTYIGDLVPAAAMIALRAAVEGEVVHDA